MKIGDRKFKVSTSLFVVRIRNTSSVTVVVDGFGPGPSFLASPNFLHN